MQMRDHEQTVIDSLYRIGVRVSHTEDPKVALQLILDEIVRVLQPDIASISLIHPESKRLDVEVSHGPPEDRTSLGLAPGQSITEWAALHGRAIRVPDARKEPRFRARPEIRSEMAVPMEERDMVIGVVHISGELAEAYTEQSLKILTLLANEATHVVSRPGLIKQLRTKANQLESLVNMGRGLVSQLDRDEILEKLAREGRQLLNCQCCALFLLTSDKKTLRLHHLVGRSGPIAIEQSVRVDDSSVSAVIRHRKQVEVTDLALTEENEFLHVIQNEGLISMLASPVFFGDEVIGALNAYTRRRHRFNDDEKKVFATLASLGAIAIQNARLYSRVFTSEESLQRNDKLTTLGMLAAEIAHEIRNPLTVIKLLFDSIDPRFPEDEERQTDVNVIREKLDQLEEIVGRVLSFGRSRESMHSRQDLNGLVRDTLLLVRLKLRQQRIGIQFEPAAGSVLVKVNKGQIQQVLLNLILNATQAMPEGGNIHIATDSSSHHAELTIRDSGPGIPEDLQGTIFDSFLTDRPDGTGLGLSISKRILRSHRGNIELAATSPEGTSFRFWIPRQR